jgi:nicotinate-nucleotide pyrophosphorylase (carboxylating)
MPVTDADVERWLREDLGHHDVTNDLPGTASGQLVATESGVAAGIDAAVAVFEYLDVGVDRLAEAGQEVDGGDPLLAVEGSTRAVLRAERTAVNVAAHASGVATRTGAAVDAVEAAVADTSEVDAPPRIAATRKTTPGLRGVEKRAVAAGGGDTHRLDLSHMAMVKDNHAAAVGFEAAVERVRERASFATQVEVEVASPDDAPVAVDAGADIVMFDNCDPEAVERGVELVREADPAAGTDRAVLTEASGGLTIPALAEYATTGVDICSLGSLTHSAPALDLSFRLDD